MRDFSSNWYDFIRSNRSACTGTTMRYNTWTSQFDWISPENKCRQFELVAPIQLGRRTGYERYANLAIYEHTIINNLDPTEEETQEMLNKNKEIDNFIKNS